MHAVCSSPFRSFLTLLLFHVSAKGALLRAVYNHNGISQDFTAMDSHFGPVLHRKGLLGYLVKARPANACRPLKPPPSSNKSVIAFIALIQRFNCSFATKVLHAQRAGYHAAIIHNVNSDVLVTMMIENDDERQKVAIPSWFIRESSSAQLKRIFHYDSTAYLILVPECHWLFCSDGAGNSCQPPPQKPQPGTLKQNGHDVPALCHFIHDAHYLLFGLLLAFWVAALYALWCW